MYHRRIKKFIFLFAIWTTFAHGLDDKLIQNRLIAPEGYQLSVYATDLANARILKLTEVEDLIVSQPELGKITLLIQGDKGVTSRRIDLLTHLNQPHGITLHEGFLYVAETDAIGRIRFDEKQRKLSGIYQRIAKLPAEGDHWQRNLSFGPDGFLYVTVGSSCNACIETDPRRATMLRFKPEGGEAEIIASGLRNTEGFDWHPISHELYGVDNGRDFLGDDFPPCELNKIEVGKFYGWPFANGDKIPDPDLGLNHEAQIQLSIPPIHTFKAHSAPLNIHFLRGIRSETYQNAALVTLHGSWNRSKKQGYEIVSLHFQKDGTILEKPFLKGFELNENIIGRPVDIAESPNGTLYISDDYSGRIYKLKRTDHG